MELKTERLDHQIIYQIVDSESKVLDLGCGRGELLLFLAKGKQAKGQGVELDDQSIHACVEHGLSVFHSDIDGGLPYYPDKSFDYVILNQSLQEVKAVNFVIREAMRVGKKVIIGFPNFAQLKARLTLCFAGQSPVTPSLPYRWDSTPNLRFLSINDFKEFCKREKITVLQSYYLGNKKKIWFWPNLFAYNAIFVIEGNPSARDTQDSPE